VWPLVFGINTLPHDAARRGVQVSKCLTKLGGSREFSARPAEDAEAMGHASGEQAVLGQA
jgi:hypothetical protein